MLGGDWLSIFYLADQEPTCVVCIYYRYARYHRDHHGHVSFRVDYGCIKHGGFWTGPDRRKKVTLKEQALHLA